MIRTPPPTLPLDPAAMQAHHRAVMRDAMMRADAAEKSGQHGLAESFRDRWRIHSTLLRAMGRGAIPA